MSPLERVIRFRLFVAYGGLVLGLWTYGEVQWLWWRIRRRAHIALPWEIRRALGLPPDWASVGGRRHSR